MGHGIQFNELLQTYLKQTNIARNEVFLGGGIEAMRKNQMEILKQGKRES